MIADLIKNVPLFAELTEVERLALADGARLRAYQVGEQVFARGAPSDAFFLIQEGWVRLTHEGSRSAVATLGTGSLLGEVDFFVAVPRSITAYASTPLSLWTFDEAAVRDAIRQYNGIGTKLGIALGCGIAQYRMYLLERLAHVSMFQGMDQEGRQALAERLSPQRYQPNQVIFRSGDVASGLYLIDSGSVRLIDDHGQQTALGPGETCGELAVLAAKPHPHTAQAADQVVLWHLSPTDFARLIEADPNLRATLGRNLRSPLSAADLVQAVEVLKRMPLFAELSRQELDDVAAGLLLRYVPAGETVYQPGDVGDAMYFVESGQIEITTGADEGYPKTLARLIPGDFFGEMAVMTGRSRTVTARAVVNSNVWALYHSDFDKLLVRYPRLTMSLSHTLRERLSQARGDFVAAYLHKLAMAGDLSRVQIEELARHLTSQSFQPGTVIYLEGRLGDSMYFVESGRVELVANGPHGPVALETLETGDFCGEVPLLTGKPHIGTARVVEEGTLWVLRKPDFEAMLGKYPNLAVALSRVLSERQTNALSKLRENVLGPGSQPPATPPTAHPARQARAAAAPAVRPGTRASRSKQPSRPAPARRPAPGQAHRPPAGSPRPGAGQAARPVVTPSRAAPPGAAGQPARPAAAPGSAPRPGPTGEPARPAAQSAPRVEVPPAAPASAPQVDPRDRSPGAASAAMARPETRPAVSRQALSGPARPGLAGRLSRVSAESTGRPEAHAAAPTQTTRPAAVSEPAARPFRQAADETRRPALARSAPPERSTRRATEKVPVARWPAAAPEPRPRPGSPAVLQPERPSAGEGISRGAKLVSNHSGGIIGEVAVWFSTRSRRVKVGLILLLILLIWLCGITLPAALINELAANLNGGENDRSSAYAQGDPALIGQSPMILLQRVRQNGAVAALPFIETVTPIPSTTPTPTDTPTVTPTPTGTPLPTLTPTPLPTDTPLPPTDTPAAEPTATSRPRPRAPTDTPEPTPTPTPDVDYLIASVRRLAPCENNGNHHIYIHVVDQAGSGVNGVPLKVCWGTGENDCARPLTETKSNGPGWVEFAMFKGTYNVRVDGAKSQVASGITPDYQKDELCTENGNSVANSLYHASFEVLIQKVR